MRNFYLGSLIFTSSALFFAACGGPATNSNTNANSNTSTNKAPVASNAVNSNGAANLPAGTTAKPVGEKINDAPTLAPVVHAYYDALKTKNTAALKETMTADFIKRSEEHMREDGAKDLAAYMAEFDTIPEKPVEVRNERFDGDKASVEILGGAYPVWTPFVMAKENGKWKFTGESPDLKAVTGK
ncbi:MAG: hypothetical protein UZ17_ACD001002432 [Acidobacteria bacterium OLB17]|nr:MAG: hypothetical protein UZ17_ACD001002432 [Acidobacteria bacterium OLB17]MCZ2389956.1 nuclear transport factor 2 family protein [Acidobacteriota bacterium]